MVVALGFARLHHCSWYKNREVVTRLSLLKVLRVSFFRGVVLFLELEFWSILDIVTVDEVFLS